MTATPAWSTRSSGARAGTPERYDAKLAAVARAIRASCPGGPDLVALQEVESRQALADLRDRHLAGLGYRHLVFVPQPGAVTGVAFLSRLPVLRTHALAVGSFEGEPLRQIVEIEVEHRGRRLRVLNNHWKSKTEGVERTAPGRQAAAEVLARRVGRVLAEDPAADLLALGDFNQNLEELEPWTREAGLRDPWNGLPPERRGSAVFRGRLADPGPRPAGPGAAGRQGFACRRGGFRVVRTGDRLSPALHRRRRLRSPAAAAAPAGRRLGVGASRPARSRAARYTGRHMAAYLSAEQYLGSLARRAALPAGFCAATASLSFCAGGKARAASP